MPSDDSQPLAPLFATIQAANAWFIAMQVPHLFIGGVAASILGRPRLTRDVDAVVWLRDDNWQEFADNGITYGFEPRIDGVVAFARRSRVLLMRHVASSIELDISFAALPYEREAIERGLTKTVGGILLRVPTPEDLVVMKVLANRPRDISDIEGLVATNSNLNWSEMRRLLTSFAELLEQPELATALDRFQK